MANSTIKNQLKFVTHTFTDTTDGEGRISLNVKSTSPCLTIECPNAIVSGFRRDQGNANRTIVFVKSIDNQSILSNTEVNGSYSYISGGYISSYLSRCLGVLHEYFNDKESSKPRIYFNKILLHDGNGFDNQFRNFRCKSEYSTTVKQKWFGFFYIFFVKFSVWIYSNKNKWSYGRWQYFKGRSGNKNTRSKLVTIYSYIKCKDILNISERRCIA